MSWLKRSKGGKRDPDPVQEKTSMDDLVERNDLYYKRFTDVPFTGLVNQGTLQGPLIKGIPQEIWISYYENGQPEWKGRFFRGEKSGLFTFYDIQGRSESKEDHTSELEKNWVGLIIQKSFSDNVTKFIGLEHQLYLEAKAYLDEVKPRWRTIIDNNEKDHFFREILKSLPDRSSERSLGFNELFTKVSKYLGSAKCLKKYEYKCEDGRLIRNILEEMVKEEQGKLGKHSQDDLENKREYLDRSDLWLGDSATIIGERQEFFEGWAKWAFHLISICLRPIMIIIRKLIRTKKLDQSD